MARSYMKIILTDWLGNPNCNVQTRLVPKAHLPLIFSTMFMTIRRPFIINGEKEIFPMGADKWKTPL